MDILRSLHICLNCHLCTMFAMFTPVFYWRAITLFPTILLWLLLYYYLITLLIYIYTLYTQLLKPR